MCKLLFCLGLLFFVAYAMEEDERQNVKSELQKAEKEITMLIDDTIRDTNEKIDQKVRQASKKGASSEECARKAGKHFFTNVKRVLEYELGTFKNSLMATRRSIEEKTISEQEFNDLKDHFSEKVYDKMEQKMTTAGAKVESLGLEYALRANKC